MKPIEGMTQTQADEMLVIMWVALAIYGGSPWSYPCGVFALASFVRVLHGRARNRLRTSTKDYL